MREIVELKREKITHSSCRIPLGSNGGTEGDGGDVAGRRRREAAVGDEETVRKGEKKAVMGK